MLRAFLCRFLSLWLVLGYQCSWAAVPRKTKLKLETSVVKTASPFPVFSGDRVTFHIVLTHVTTSQAKAVDALVKLQIPIYLKVVSYNKGNGLPWSSVDTAEKWTMKFKFDDIMVSKFVNLSLVVDVDPYYIANAAASHNVAILADLWYYGDDGPCSRPPSMYNALHEFERLSLKFESTTECEKRIQLQNNQYSASSASTNGPAYSASFSHAGVWQTADYLATDKNQYLQLDLSRLMRITKIATRGQTTPSVAFVRTYQVYHSKDIVEWFSSRENNDIKVFQGNTDGQNVVFNPMPSPALARYLRIVAKSWKRRQAMDVEVFGCQVHPNENLVDYCPIFDFENGVSDWTSTGTAFKNQPTIGDNYKVRTGKSGNIQGNSWIGTYEDRMRSYIPAGGKQGDAPIGTLTSPSFLVVASKFHFLIGGTKNNTDARAELVVDGKSVRKTSCTSNAMTENTWFVKQFRGKEAVLRLVDDTDKGHLNFDAFRVDCFLDADAHDISLPSRAVMLNSRTHSFYVCDSSHLRSEDSALCRVMNGLNDRWIDIPDILGLLGVDKSTHQLYAISRDRYVITSINPAGGDWRYIKKSDWDEAKSKSTMIRMVAIPWITLRDGVNEQILKTLADSNGDQWKATSLGISYKPAGQSLVKIAAWRCHALETIEDPCFSEPCEHHANCTAVSRDKYNCSCVPGYTGVNCETDIDECANVICENGGTCVQGINKYFCRCPFGVSGFHCENLLPACRTSPCLNGGTCVDEIPPAFRCDCTSNYKGTLCEIEKEPCLVNPCSNGGVCVPNEGGGYSCVCKYGYTGTTCSNGVETNFNILQSRTVTDVNSYLVIRAQIPDHGKSHNENWCKDYERLCAKLDREATGLGRSYNHIEGYASCQEKYHSVMDRANVLGAKPNEKVAALAQQVGFTDATPNNSFAFNACDGTKCSDILPDSGCHQGLSCISKSVPNREVYTVCLDVNSQFRTLRKVWGIVNGVRLLMLRVKSPSAYSKLTTWCDDYEELCDRYGQRATGDKQNTGCVEKYRAIFNANNNNGQVRNAVGAGSGFYFRDCSYCNSYSYSTSNAVHYFKYYYNHFGVACMQPNGIGFKVLDDKKLASYNGKDYTVIKVQVPSNGKSNDTNWCEDYKQLCDSYKMVPLGCGYCATKYRSSSTTCPISGNEVEQMVRDAGFSNVFSSNTFVYKSCEACSGLVTKDKCRAEDLFCFDEGNPYRVFYTACVKDDKKFLPKQRGLQMRDFKFIVYQSMPYKVLRLFYLPEDGKPVLSNWCEEYQTLCTSVGGRPVGCGPSYTSNADVATCGSVYGADMENDGLRCGNDNSMAVDMAKTAGYHDSSIYNTFKFNDCSSASCTQQLTFSCSSYYSTCSCHPALSCLNTKMSRYSREAFAVCSMTNTAFKVLETKDSTYGGHDVLVVKAQIPSDGSSLTGNWCEEYRALCFNYGYRPTGCGEDHADDTNYASCRYDYQSVMPKDNVYGCPAVGKIALIANAAGFDNATAGNSFGFSDCNATCVSTLTSGGPFIDLSVADGIVYTICETSNSHFKVMSAVQSVYKGGEYTYVQALVPQDLISKHDTWCTDYQRMCESFGLMPVARSGYETENDYVRCRKDYGAINTKLNEATTSHAIEIFGDHFLRHSRVRNIQNSFVFGKNCDGYCVKDMNNGYYKYALEYLRPSYMPNHDYNVFTVCASSDSNFHVISTKTIAHKGQDYLVIMAKLPAHRMSKYENWCRDYERLCRSFRKRPTGCGLSYQWSSKHRACVDKYQSAMAMNDPVGCNSSESVAAIANLAGYKSADTNNSFAFHQCSSECPQTLSSSCSDALLCLNDRSDIVYTLCTDSSSAFEVERVLHTNEGNTPLLFIIATLNGAVTAKSGVWCTDYEWLCQSYAARPVGCYSSKDDDLTKCSTKYNAVPLQSDIQQCGNDGESDIARLRVLTPSLTDGAHFKCHKCKKSDCKKTLSSSCNSALNCLKESDWVYTTCSRASHNFDIIDTKTTSHGELTDILVIKARVPTDGRSLYDSWCEDYTKLCSTYDKVPLACPLRSDYAAESAYRACNKEYNGYMMRNYTLKGNTTLSCPLNNLISDIAKQAKFSKPSPSRTLGLNTCLSCSKTLQIVNGGAYLSMSCPPDGTCKLWNATALDREVFLLCVKPPRVNSTFHIDEVRFVKQRGRKYASVRVSMPYGEESIHDDWCTDYQKICESISMRPIAAGRSQERLIGRRKCREKYNAVMPSEYDNSNHRFIGDIARATGYNYNENTVFSLNDCNLCSRNIFDSRGVDSIYSTDSTYYTACTYSDSSFEELQKRNVTVDGKSFLAVKAQLPADMVSTHETWCKDYQMMCESYGKRPLTCAEHADLQTSYNALLLTHNCDSSIPKQAGFADATEENTLVFKSYNRGKCSRKLRNADSPFGRLNSSVPHRLVYAICLNSATAFEVLAKKIHRVSDRTYLFLQVAMPENGKANYDTWCHEYKELCREYGKTPVSCTDYHCRINHGALRKREHVCPLDQMVSLAEGAGMSQVTKETSFLYFFICNVYNCKKVVETRNCTARGKKIPLCFDRDVNNGEFTTVCATPTEKTGFSILDVKYVKYLGRPYTVIRTRKNYRDSRQNNWCNDYKHLCRSFTQRPLACPTRYNTDPDLHLCQRNYDGVSMETDSHACPMNKFVAELAQYAGFSRATPRNSFAFRNCHSKFCTNRLPTNECSEALYCVNMLGDQEDLYTACAGSDSAFNVYSYRLNVNYNYINYGVIKVTVSEGQKSAHGDWCKDYQRLCESWNMEAVQCASSLEPASDICSINYGAHQKLSSCTTDAKAIAVKANLGHVADKTAVVMDGCKYCPNIVTKTCSSSLNCLRSGTLFVVCSMKKQVGVFKSVQTRFVNYGNAAYLLIQSQLSGDKSTSFMNEYNDLCQNIYGYQPILCGRSAVSGSSQYRSCSDYYANALSHQGNDFYCPPAKTVAFIAQKFGFYQATHDNSFAFYKCSKSYYYNRYYGYQLSSTSCFERLWCLRWGQYHQLQHTMCAVPKPSPSLGFHVLNTKDLIFLGIKYVAFKLSIGTSGVSATDNWCLDYRELCRKHNMDPTGCGTSEKKVAGYLQCSSKYRSFMSHRNAVGCGKNSAPSSLARRAGFPGATQENTFVFNDCSKCAKNLPPTSCDPALTCLYSEVFNKYAYTLCVERKSGFEYIAKKKTIYGGVEYLVVRSALPVDNRPLYDNWCVDYQKLCYSVGAFPVACSLGSGVQDSRRFAEKYGAITVEDIPCPPIAKVLAIVKKAGYSKAIAGNSFVFTGLSSDKCSKDLPTVLCTPGLDCLNQQSREVYAVCINPTNFAVSDVRTSRHSGNTFTVVEATLPTSGLSKTSSWCEDYATLCRSMRQQPVVCPGYGGDKYEKCRDNYDGYLLFDKFECNAGGRRIYEIAHLAGFAKGNFANTIGFASCASCSRELHAGPECDSSMNCVNNQTADRLVYALCLRESQDSSFQVIETKETITPEVEYKVVKAIVSPFGNSKYDTWCKDYERMCSVFEMRPLRCSLSDGNPCPLMHKALVSSQEQFSCDNNTGLLQFVKSAGYSEANERNTFIFGACSTAEQCRKTLLNNSCDSSMNCLKKQPASRLVFTLCARRRHTSFRYLDSAEHTHNGVNYFVIKASKFSDQSKSINWCYDYRDMCVSFGKQPIVWGSFGEHFNDDRNQCFGAYNATSTMVWNGDYNAILKEMSMPYSSCRVVYTYCRSCVKTFEHCPFRACNCDLFYLFCL